MAVLSDVDTDDTDVGIWFPALKSRFLLRIDSGAMNYDAEALVNQVISYTLKTVNDPRKVESKMLLEVVHEVDAYFDVLAQFSLLTKNRCSTIEIFSMTGTKEYYSMARLDVKLLSWDTGQDYASNSVMHVVSQWEVRDITVVPAGKMKKKVKIS